MVVSLLLDLLLRSVEAQGCLPRRVFIQADNTAKETKNFIVLFGATWLLAQLSGTRLAVIDFAYLIVGPAPDSTASTGYKRNK